MKQAADYITEEKRQSLLAELKDLKGPKRREILESLEYAKSLGDLSENAEYDEAKNEQAFVVMRIAELQQILEKAQKQEKSEKKKDNFILKKNNKVLLDSKQVNFRKLSEEEIIKTSS